MPEIGQAGKHRHHHGPEGGFFSEKEAQQIVEAGGKSVSLGKTTLRTETAGFCSHRHDAV